MNFAYGAKNLNPQPVRQGQVIDLGELEIEGEVRKPNINWIDSQKKLKNMMPIYHQIEFSNLEKQMLVPESPKQAEMNIEIVKAKAAHLGE
jgi:hypothetical protein